MIGMIVTTAALLITIGLMVIAILRAMALVGAGMECQETGNTKPTTQYRASFKTSYNPITEWRRFIEARSALHQQIKVDGRTPLTLTIETMGKGKAALLANTVAREDDSETK